MDAYLGWETFRALVYGSSKPMSTDMIAERCSCHRNTIFGLYKAVGDKSCYNKKNG